MENKKYYVTESKWIALNEIEDFVLDHCKRRTWEQIEALKVCYEIGLVAFDNSCYERDDAFLDCRKDFIVTYMCELYEKYDHYFELRDYEKAQAYLYMWDWIAKGVN